MPHSWELAPARWNQALLVPNGRFTTQFRTIDGQNTTESFQIYTPNRTAALRGIRIVKVWRSDAFRMTGKLSRNGNLIPTHNTFVTPKLFDVARMLLESFRHTPLDRLLEFNTYDRSPRDDYGLEGFNHTIPGRGEWNYDSIDGLAVVNFVVVPQRCCYRCNQILNDDNLHRGLCDNHYGALHSESFSAQEGDESYQEGVWRPVRTIPLLMSEVNPRRIR